MLNCQFRLASLQDLPEMQQLFVDSITNSCVMDYDQQQIEVWTASVHNQERWQGIVKEQYVLLALDKNKIIGFCSLDKGNYVDMLYVHQDFQGQTVAFQLYQAIEQEAQKQNTQILSADVSKTAKCFFERMGFLVETEQTVVRNGVALTNFKMKKMLPHTPHSGNNAQK